METKQIVYGVALVLACLGLAGFFGLRAWRLLRRLRATPHLDPDEQQYAERQVRRRLIGSGLMVVLAGLLIGSFPLEGPANQLVERGRQAAAKGEKPEMSPEEERAFHFYMVYWASIGLVLLAILIVAAFDFFAIRRYGRTHYRRIQEGRRAMIEDELSRLRTQRNGHG